MFPAYFTLIISCPLLLTAQPGTEPGRRRRDSLDCTFGSLQLLDLARKPLEVIEHRRNQFLSAGVLLRQGVGKKVEQVTGFLGSFRPTRSWSRDQLRFQLVLSEAQGSFVGLHI